jgi:hypothetical protein
MAGLTALVAESAAGGGVFSAVFLHDALAIRNRPPKTSASFRDIIDSSFVGDALGQWLGSGWRADVARPLASVVTPCSSG